MSTSQWPRCLQPLALWGCVFEESRECYRVWWVCVWSWGGPCPLSGCRAMKEKTILIRWSLRTAVLRHRIKIKSRSLWIFCVLFVFSECGLHSLRISLAFIFGYILLFPFSLNRLNATVRRKVCRSVVFTLRLERGTIGSRFTTIHFYDPCRVGPSTPDLWCITVTTQASFLYLVRF